MLPATIDILETMTDAFLALDADGSIVYVNAQAERLLERDREELLQLPLANALPDWNVAALQEAILHALHSRSTQLLDSFMPSLQRWFQIRIVSKQESLCFYFWDVTDRLQAQKTRLALQQGPIGELKQQYSKVSVSQDHDMSNLTDRSFLIASLREALRDTHNTVALLCLTFAYTGTSQDGQDTSLIDDLATAIGLRLTACLRPLDLVTRIQSDQFALLLYSPRTKAETSKVVGRIQDKLEQPFILRGQKLEVTASIGIVQTVFGYDDPENALRDAELAMYHAKSLGQDQVVFFEPGLRDQAVPHISIEAELRQALTNNELEVYYQPIVDLKTEAVVALEGLARWVHPFRGSVSPEQFISVAEDSELIIELDFWVLKTACQQMQQWQRGTHRLSGIALNVNFSGRQLARQDLMIDLQKVLGASESLSQGLNLEVTETLLMNADKMAQSNLQGLQKLGISLHIDDFGTGQSSLKQLQQVKAQFLKIDRSFVRRLVDEPASLQFMQAIIAMAHTLEMQVVAEGIETAEELALLKKMHCDYGQGYYFAEPMPAAQVPERLRVLDARQAQFTPG